jgi:TetR/AcrR family transcriptional regulator, repressor for neighboring sulfatase
MSPTSAPAPYGEHEVRQALIEAATVLFAEQGPGAVPVREIARRAGVNHGLVHRYFGSKDGLVSAVLDRLSAQSTAEVESHEPSVVTYSAEGPTATQGRILAHLLLAGADPADFKSDYPAARTMIRHCRQRGMSDRQARERVAQVLALVLGWQFFEPFVMSATGLAPSEKAANRLLDDAATRLLDENRG